MENVSWIIQPALAVSSSFLIAARAYEKKSLNFSGALAGFLVMTIHLAAGLRYGAMLLIFFHSSSTMTKYGAEQKRKIDAEYKEGGQRNWIQVLSNSAIATVLVVAVWWLTGWQDKCLNSKEEYVVTYLLGGIIGHYCCCIGDTWSSEMGVMSKDQPRLITNFKRVHKGTNGAVTRKGLIAATVGGLLIGFIFVVFGFLTAKCTSFEVLLKQLLVIPLSGAAGLCGSLIDSLLGATVQFSGFCSVRKKVVSAPSPSVRKISGFNILDNNAVNVLSILLTTLLTAVACGYIF